MSFFVIRGVVNVFVVVIAVRVIFIAVIVVSIVSSSMLSILLFVIISIITVFFLECDDDDIFSFVFACIFLRRLFKKLYLVFKFYFVLGLSWSLCCYCY